MRPAVFSTPDRTTRRAVLLLTAVVFAVVLAAVTLLLRGGLQDQILRREAELLAGVASMQLANEAAKQRELGVELPGDLYVAVLNTSRLRGVIATRVFDAQRGFAGASPFEWSDELPSVAVWEQMAAGMPEARLHARRAVLELQTLIGLEGAAAAAAPLVELWVPLRRPEGRFEGAAQFWMDGRSVAAEFHALDRRLLAQVVIAWSAGTLVIMVALFWVFRRLAAANRELRARTDDLLRANRELVLAAKTSALGTVTAHLIHALKNPIAGLETFVASQSEPEIRNGRGEELAAATELTKRLRRTVNDVVGVLRDEHAGAHFELTAEEVVEIALAKTRAIAADRNVNLVTHIGTNATVPGRSANLAALVLQNLLQNAVEASAPSARVTVSADRNGSASMEFLVTDEGRGLPATVTERLFEPCISSKAGGSGLGLALSAQLARQAGGRLELVRSDARGTCFRLTVDSAA